MHHQLEQKWTIPHLIQDKHQQINKNKHTGDILATAADSNPVVSHAKAD